jgi:putative membrane protein
LRVRAAIRHGSPIVPTQNGGTSFARGRAHTIGGFMKIRTSLLGHVAIVLTVAACGASGQTQQPSQVSTTGAGTTSASDTSVAPSQSQPQAMTTANDNNTTAPTQVMPSGTSMYNDAQIAAITTAAHEGEIEQAKLALRKGKDPQVKAFAQMMMDQHGEAKKQGQALATSLGMSPEATPASTQLQGDTQSAVSSLSALSGNEFDKAYVDLQVKNHKDVLEMLDDKLIPSAHNAELKKDLTDFRPKVVDHLQRAEALQQMLSKK